MTAVLMLAALCAYATTVATPSAQTVAYARGSQFSLPALSPEGSMLAFVRHDEREQCVAIRPIARESDSCVLRFEARRERVRWCGWSGPVTLICGTAQPVRLPDRVAEQTRLHAVDTRTSKSRLIELPGNDTVRDRVVDLTPHDDRHILVQHDPAGAGYPQVSEVDLYGRSSRVVTGARRPVRQWLSDGAGKVRLGIGYDSGVATLLARGRGANDWTVLMERALADPQVIAPLSFGPSDDELFALGNHGGRSALFRIRLSEPDERQLVFSDPIYDVTGPLLRHPAGGQALAVFYSDQHERLHYLDADSRRQQLEIDQQLSGRVNLVVDQSADRRRLLIRSYSDVDPPTLYMFDVAQQRVRLLAHEYPQLEALTHSPMKAIVYRARDGQAIPAYLTLPVGHPARGLPAVVLPHGGPEARDRWGFDPMVQWLAARGYAVLQMNFRGSTGYGGAFAAAGLGQWGGTIHNDITDGARWLVERQIADPTRICILGRSFGGYAALLGAARESQWYSCAASFGGASDLLAFSQYAERLPAAQLWCTRLGSDSRALWQMSPIARVQAIETPVLLMHGRNDAVVPVSQARRMARALRSAGKPHRYIERSDCDHEMTVESCRIAFFSELERFLAEALPPPSG